MAAVTFEEALIDGDHGKSAQSHQEAADQLPEWCYNTEAKVLADKIYTMELERGVPPEPLPLQSVAGPAVPIALKALKFTWLFFAIFPWPVSLLSHCSDQGFASYPLWIWIMGVLFLGFCLVYEWKCLSYIIVPIAQVVSAKFTFMGKRLEFSHWLFLTSCMTVLSHMDILTNGLFLAVTLKTQECIEMGDQSAKRFELVWHQTLSQSLIWWCPMSFGSLALFGWLLMFLQPCYALVASTPLYDIKAFVSGTPVISVYRWFEKTRCWRTPTPTEYRMHTLEEAWIFSHRHSAAFSYFQTFADNGDRSFSDLGTSLLTLAETFRATTLTFTRFMYSQVKVKQNLAHPDPRVGPAFGLISRELNKNNYRLLCQGFLENGVQLNIQMSLLSMNRYITGTIDKQVAFSVLLGLMLSFRGVYDGISKIHWAHHICFAEYSEVFAKFKLVLKRKLRINVCLVVLYASSLLYVMFKLVGFFICKDSMINLTGCPSLSV